MKEVTLLDLLKNGVHFGHQKSRRHPKMESYIFTLRDGVHIINLEKTLDKLKEACEFVKSISQKKGKVLFVGTKRQAKGIVKKYAESCGMPYITEKWLGGMFTNFSHVSKLYAKLNKLEKEKLSGELGKYTKKEQLKFEEEIKKLNSYVGGVKNMNVLPQAVFVVDIKQEKTAITESAKKGIPIIAVVDTNTNPELVEYPIPGNDDATKSIEYLTGLIADAIIEGQAAQGAVVPVVKKENEEAKKETANKKE